MELRKAIALFILVATITVNANAVQTKENDSTKVDIQYTSKGFQFTSPDSKYRLQIGGRLQFRYAYPGDQDPVTFDDFEEQTRNIFKINRARLKVGGFAHQPWLKYYFEYELSSNRLLNFEVMVEKYKWLSFRAGQWKVDYSRERSISSGKQQMLERSIINRPFTLDRQQGVSAYGRVDQGNLLDFNYSLSILTGSGRGARDNDDRHLMYVGKVYWNFLGDGVDMSGSDIDYLDKPQASIAVAGATNTSMYTRFSSSGGGDLEGYEDIGQPGQYQVDQYVIESAFEYKGFSWQSEYHQKRIKDTRGWAADHYLWGYYGQGGYIFNHNGGTHKGTLMEVAGRYAYYRPDKAIPRNSTEEYALAFNMFFDGHRSKLTTDVTYFDFDRGSMDRRASSWRVRVQYDFSF
ncbi:OprO/OprP family phosphate-selective porin [Echinicola shivajiensis]|uniref:OprO/OprP family phosphate-selective porin n=1 Tax=Echinicola shivajiensis TaxID=1035916 RepID=UPI001BFCD2C3|nr:porin [Echinicola shivajiensis]